MRHDWKNRKSIRPSTERVVLSGANKMYWACIHVPLATQKKKPTKYKALNFKSHPLSGRLYITISTNTVRALNSLIKYALVFKHLLNISQLFQKEYYGITVSYLNIFISV